MGDGGNTIYVNTKKKLVISIAALFVPKAGDRIELIKKFIEPILWEEQNFFVKTVSQVLQSEWILKTIFMQTVLEK